MSAAEGTPTSLHLVNLGEKGGKNRAGKKRS